MGFFMHNECKIMPVMLYSLYRVSHQKKSHVDFVNNRIRCTLLNCKTISLLKRGIMRARKGKVEWTKLF